MAVEGLRARLRAELTEEIKRAARAQLTEAGAAGLSLRAVARDLGMVSSAIYRYFATRDELLTALIIDAYDALGAEVEAAAAAAQARGESLEQRWKAIGSAVRGWALAHPHEYALIFGSPVPGYSAPEDTIPSATRVPAVMVGLLAELSPVPDPQAVDVPPAVVRDLEALAAQLGTAVRPDLLARGLMAWTYVFGAVSFELFGHRNNVIHDRGAFFDHEMERIAALVGARSAPRTA